MEEDFKDIIEKIKSETIDQEETKKYILSIKRVVKRLYDICKDEEEEAEIIAEYLEDYGNDLKFRGKAEDVFNKMLMYSAYKRLLQDFKQNKINFDCTLKEARMRESADNQAAVTINTDIKEAMISAVRYVMRTRKITREREILEALQEEKRKTDTYLRERMINILHPSVIFLSEYGFIDEYISSSNEELKQLGLEEIQYEKRNPIADFQYDENGNLVHDVEDIGVIDTFEKDYLEQLSVEDLAIMTAFWESKYLQERLGLSKAMAIIKTLNLWDVILHQDDEAIQNLDEALAGGALKKDLALTYMCRSGCELTSKMEKQYKKFLENEGMSTDTDLVDEINATSLEVSNLESAARDVAILECLILHQLMTKELKIKKWGVIDNSPPEDEMIPEDQIVDNSVTLAIENKTFRGPLIMAVPKHILENFFGTSQLNLPQYEKRLNETYCSIMSKLYLPTNKFFTNTVKKAYNNNPSSPFLADLAGKKVQPSAGGER